MKKFENLVIASDLDNTFLGNGKVIERNIEALEYFKDNGGLFTLATGRIHYVLERLLPGVAELVNFPAIVGNGSYLFDYQKREFIDECFIDKTAFYDIADTVYKLFPEVALKGNTKIGVFTRRADERFMRSILENEPHFVFGENEEFNEGVYKIVIAGAPDKLKETEKCLKEKLAGYPELLLSYSCPVLLEVLNRRGTKGERLKRLRELPIAAGRKVIGAGDYDNDLDLLSGADFAVCPENANDNVKKTANLILCDASRGIFGDLIELLDSNKIQI